MLSQISSPPQGLIISSSATASILPRLGLGGLAQVVEYSPSKCKVNPQYSPPCHTHNYPGPKTFICHSCKSVNFSFQVFSSNISAHFQSPPYPTLQLMSSHLDCSLQIFTGLPAATSPQILHFSCCAKLQLPENGQWPRAPLLSSHILWWWMVNNIKNIPAPWQNRTACWLPEVREISVLPCVLFNI